MSSLTFPATTQHQKLGVAQVVSQYIENIGQECKSAMSLMLSRSSIPHNEQSRKGERELLAVMQDKPTGFISDIVTGYIDHVKGKCKRSVAFVLAKQAIQLTDKVLMHEYKLLAALEEMPSGFFAKLKWRNLVKSIKSELNQARVTLAKWMSATFSKFICGL